MPDAALLNPAAYFLPVGYAQQDRNTTLDSARDLQRDGAYWAPWRVRDAARWQRHVYALAARTLRHLINTNPSRTITALDVGCGVCVKLDQHLAPTGAEVVGIDQPSALAVARTLGSRARLHPVDLERADLDLNTTFDVILCADVLEHLINPDRALDLIRRHATPDTIIILSTPERDRERGRDCRASAKPEHVREWAFAEFAAYVQSRGLLIHRHALSTKDESPPLPARRAERAFRALAADRSPLCCQIIVARIAPPNTPLPRDTPRLPFRRSIRGGTP